MKVTAKIEGYRRSGLGFSAAEATEIEDGQLTKSQIEAIKADPNLIVEGEAKAKAEPKAKKDD